jgi:cell division protein FtsA
VLGLPARRGAPRGFGGLVDVVRSPEYATGVGLVLFGARGERLGSDQGQAERDRGVFKRMRGWISEMF